MRTGEHRAGRLHVEAQTWLWAGPELHGAEFDAVRVDPGALDPQLGGECRRVDQPTGGGGVALAAHQFDYSSRDGLHGGRVECGVGVGVLGMVVELWAVVLGHQC
jgi:hypothetical protein